MNKSKDLTGQKFGKLTVISKAESILGGITVKRLWGAWNCQCDCGKAIIVKTIDLNRSSTKSCGCLYDEFGKSLKPGQKINRLTTISYKNGKWFCLCECGNHIEVTTDRLNSGNTKSCGCLKSEISSENSTKLIERRRQFEPNIASARRVWKKYGYRDENMTIIFDEFLNISQQNCFYCGIVPNTYYNHFSTLSSRSSEKAKNEGLFIYNGMDRIDSSKSHTTDNVVPCCPLCNRAKNDRTTKDFLVWVTQLKIVNFTPIVIPNIIFPENTPVATSVKCVFYNHKHDTNITVEEYYSISQMPCFYCETLPSNLFNYAKNDKKSSAKAVKNANYIYNGIDRVNVNFPHNKNNIVPCCCYCNFAKNNLSISDFQDWIKRIQQFQNKKTATN
jgi:5-methylcytosine-specific restriction endonuclease McrA